MPTTDHVLAWIPPKPRHYRRLVPTPVPDKASPPVQPVLHSLHGDILDQGQTGECTGADTVDCLRCEPLWAMTAPAYDEATARKVYSLATTLDGFGPPYPPNDRGSSNTAAAQAAIQLGLATGASKCCDFDHFLTVMVDQPVMFASSWFNGFDNPDGDGVVEPSGDARGGHSYAAVGVDPVARMVTFLNSWGPSWGKGGYFKMSYDTVRYLVGLENEMVALHTGPNAPLPKVAWWDKALDFIAAKKGGF